jgi:hypothetical protein
MKSVLSVLAIILLFAGTSNAQMRAGGMFGDYSKKSKSKNKKHSTLLQRLTIGYGQHYVSNTLDVNYRADAVNDSSFKVALTSTAPMVGFFNFTFPLAKVSDKSAFTLDIGFSYTAFTLKYDSVIVHDGKVQTEELPVSIMSLPISFDFKTGGEATLSKENRLLFTGGIGIAPSYIMADINPEAAIKAMPFVKLEAGFFLGIAFKLRGLAYFGNAHYIDDDGMKAVVPGVTSRVSSGSYGYTISLGIMPFSYKWKPVF